MQGTMMDDQLSLATLLRYAATMLGDSTVATWDGQQTRTTTYREVGAEAARLANALRGFGIAEGDRVGTFMWNNTEHVVAYIGVPAMGAVLHALNIRLAPAQLIYVANHAADKVVLVDGTLVPLFAKYLPQLTTVRHVIVVNGDPAALSAPAGVAVHDYRELLDAQSDTFDFPVLDERSAAAMGYTSGTTGDPKGVVYTHRSNWIHAMQVVAPNGLALAMTDTVLAIVPLFHANAWGLPYAAMMSGANLLLPDRFLQPEPLLAMMAAVRPSFAAAVPTIWGGVLGALASAPQDISHLKSVVIGGAAAPPAMMRAFQDTYGVRVLHAWGMTETSPAGAVAHPPHGVTGEAEWAYRVTQGRFPANIEARLVDDDGNVLPHDGVALGELEVRGPTIAKGYYSPDDTVVAPEKFHEGWLRTGDVAKISPDGYLTLVDRTKDVIKSGGEWISSVDMENLVMAHPQVAEAAVIGVPDPKWDERPLVVYVPTEPDAVGPAQLREFLAGELAKWQVPDYWVAASELPKTSVGKFDKKLLRARHEQGELSVQTVE